MQTSGIGDAARELSQSVGRLLESASAHGRSMVEEAAAAARAERRYWLRQLICVLALVTLLLLGVVFTGVAIIVGFWDTHRLTAAIAVAGGYLLLAVVAALVLRSGRRRPAANDWLASLIMVAAQHWRGRPR